MQFTTGDEAFIQDSIRDSLELSELRVIIEVGRESRLEVKHVHAVHEPGVRLVLDERRVVSHDPDLRHEEGRLRGAP